MQSLSSQNQTNEFYVGSTPSWYACTLLMRGVLMDLCHCKDSFFFCLELSFTWEFYLIPWVLNQADSWPISVLT